MKRLVLGVFWSVVLSVMLIACGGGGGAASPVTAGGNGGDAGGAGGANNLRFTVANAGKVVGYSIWASEGLMRLGYVLSQEVAASAAHVGKSVSGDCTGVGQWTRTLTDSDGSRSLSAGDVMTVTFTGCSREPFAPSVSGSVSVTLLAATSGGGFSAQVVIAAPGLSVGRYAGATRDVDFRISGRAQLEFGSTDTSNALIISASGRDEMSLDFPGSSIPADRLREFRFEKTQRWDEARTVLDLRMRYDSDELGGGFDVVTLKPLRAWLDMVPEASPEQGSIEMRGAGGDIVKLTATKTTPLSQDFTVDLDQGGNGSIEGRGEGQWTLPNLTRGFFFSDYSEGGRGGTFSYDANEFSMRRLLRNPAGEAVDRVYRIQFTRPPVDTSAWRWRLVDRGRLPFGDGAGAEVPIQVEQKGALYIVKPAQPLRYSRNYSLELLTGVPSANGQRVSAANGTSIEIAGGSVASFPTLDYLNPFISYGGAVLKALEPEESVQMFAKPQLSGSPNVTYRWAQIGGTPVVIDQPTKPEVRVSLAGAGTGLGKATLELTLALADGTSEKTTYTLRTLHDTSGPWVSFIRFPAISANALAARVEWNGPAVGDLVLSENQGRLEIVYTEATGSVGPYASWGLALANAGNQRLVVGKYLNAWALNSVSPPLGVPNLDFSFAGTKLAPFGSEFEVFEIDRDSDGRVTKLALDYVVRGVGDFSPVTGSVRFNSSRPPTRP